MAGLSEWLMALDAAPMAAQIAAVMAIGFALSCGLIAALGWEFSRWASGRGWRWRRGRSQRRYGGLALAAGSVAALSWWQTGIYP